MRTIYIDNTILPQNKKFTYLTGDITSGVTSLGVQSISGFSSTAQILLLGGIGQEKTDILYLSHATTPSGTTIYLYGSTSFDYPQDTKLTVIDWDKIEFSHATTIAGAKTVLGTLTIMTDLPESFYKDTTKSSGYYFTNFYDSVNVVSSDYSDPIPYDGYTDNTVFMLKKRALDNCDEKIGELITHEYLNESLWEARREYHKAPGKRPFRRKFEQDLGNVSTGMYHIALPTDVEKPYTAENVYKVRIGTEEPCKYYDKKEWDDDYDGVAHTVLLTAYAITHQDLYCDNVRDFEDSGSVEIEDDTIAYSAKGVSGGTLRISTAGSYAHTADKDVWQGIDSGLPQNFTVWMNTDGTAYIYFNCPIETAYVNMNIWGDYYRTLVSYDSDADELDEPEYDVFVPYLEFKIKKRKNKGLQPLDDPSYMEWLKRKQNALGNEYLGTEIRFYPDIPPL